MEASTAPTEVKSGREFPFPVGWDLGKGCAPSQKNFSIFSFKTVHFDEYWTLNER